MQTSNTAVYIYIYMVLIARSIGIQHVSIYNPPQSPAHPPPFSRLQSYVERAVEASIQRAVEASIQVPPL